MVFLPIPLHDGPYWCDNLQAMGPGVLREMEKALEGNKRLEKLMLIDDVGVILPKAFCHNVLLGTRRSTSLSDVHLKFHSPNWDCPDDGRLVCVSHVLCDSVGCSV